MNKNNLFVIIIYIIGFSVGTITHSVDIYNMGFLGYNYAPFILNLFWTSLLFLDPLVIIFFFVRYRFAIYLAIWIMILDISINSIFGFYSYLIGSVNILPGLITQVSFGIFVFISAPKLLKFNSIQQLLFKEKFEI